jgi:gamma-D-glutamyl-L-lysine dipeptidyl-peptidase
MEYFTCENVFVPLRSGPSHKTEMLSQVLFGEKYTVKEVAGNWMKIETVFDSYIGWIDVFHLQQTLYYEGPCSHVINRSLLCYREDGTKMVLEPGCEIYDPDTDAKTFRIGKNIYKTSEDFGPAYIQCNESIADTAMKFLNSPYIWGGRIPSGIDCSGFTQLVYKIHGIGIPRDSGNQAETGDTLSFIDEANPGDLAFFDNDCGHISHVGIIISKGLIIHASGRVRIDTIDHQGIYKNEIGKYSHKLRTIKRII